MNKTELIAVLNKEFRLPKMIGSAMINTILNNITQSLSKGEAVSFIGFGTFNVKNRAARIGRNPQTGEKIKIAASKAVVFKAGKELKSAINRKK